MGGVNSHIGDGSYRDPFSGVWRSSGPIHLDYRSCIPLEAVQQVERVLKAKAEAEPQAAVAEAERAAKAAEVERQVAIREAARRASERQAALEAARKEAAAQASAELLAKHAARLQAEVKVAKHLMDKAYYFLCNVSENKRKIHQAELEVERVVQQIDAPINLLLLAHQQHLQILEAKRIATMASDQCAHEITQFTVECESKRLDQHIARVRVIIATRITPAYQAKIHSEAQQMAQQIEVKALKRLAEDPTRNLLEALIKRIDKTRVDLIAAEQKHQHQQALQAMMRRIQQEYQAKTVAEETVRIHEQIAAKDSADEFESVESSRLSTPRETVRYPLISLDLILKYAVDAINSAEHPMYHLSESSMSPATLLFCLDLIAVMAVHAPELNFNRHANQHEKSLYYMQQFFSDSSCYQRSLLRLDNQFKTSLDSTDIQAVAKTDIDSSKVTVDYLTNPALRIASDALRGLQTQMRLSKQSFFSRRPIHSVAMSQQDPELADGFAQIEREVPSINPNSLDLNIRQKIKAISVTSSVTDKLQISMAMS